MNDVVDSLLAVIGPLVERIPGAYGTLVGSADGHVFAARTPRGTDDDTIAAMSASAVGLGHRLVGLVGDEPATWCHHQSEDAQAFVLAVDHYAVLTILSDETTRPELVRTVAADAVDSIRKIFTDTD